VAEAVGAGRARDAHERGYRPLLPGRQQPAPRLRPAGAGLRRRALGHLPPDPGARRTGQEGRARHAHSLLPGQEADRRDRRAGSAEEGRRGQEGLPLREAQGAVRAPVHGVQRRAGRRAAQSLEPDARAALEGASGGGTGHGGRWRPGPPRPGRPRLLPHEARRDRAARARAVPVGERTRRRSPTSCSTGTASAWPPAIPSPWRRFARPRRDRRGSLSPCRGSRFPSAASGRAAEP